MCASAKILEVYCVGVFLVSVECLGWNACCGGWIGGGVRILGNIRPVQVVLIGLEGRGAVLWGSLLLLGRVSVRGTICGCRVGHVRPIHLLRSGCIIHTCLWVLVLGGAAAAASCRGCGVGWSVRLGGAGWVLLVGRVCDSLGWRILTV